MISSVDFRPFFCFPHWPVKEVVGTIAKEHKNVCSFTPVKKKLNVVFIHCILCQLPHYRCSPAFPVPVCYILLSLIMVTTQNIRFIREIFHISCRHIKLQFKLKLAVNTPMHLYVCTSVRQYVCTSVRLYVCTSVWDEVCRYRHVFFCGGHICFWQQIHEYLYNIILLFCTLFNMHLHFNAIAATYIHIHIYMHIRTPTKSNTS